ncbi:MAG: potassium channel family protein [Kofleriaceae bacterium]
MSPLVKRLLVGFLVLVSVVWGGATGYWLIGDGAWTFHDCLYMTVITLTTVGFGETLVGMDTVPYARDFTMVLLLFGTGTIVYFASTVTAFIVEGDLKNVLFASRMKKRIKRMKDHIIVAGAGSTGRQVIEELLKLGVPVIAIDSDERELKEIAEDFPKADYTYLVGDATDDEIMEHANFAAARGFIASLPLDKDNLYLTVSARQSNPNLRIVARCAELSHSEKIKKSGADSVVSPNYIGGMRLVSEMVRPAVVKFLDEMLRDKRSAMRFDEVTINKDDVTTLRDARVRERFGMSVVALREAASAGFTYNPDDDTKLAPGMVLVVLGSAEQVAKLREAMS